MRYRLSVGLLGFAALVASLPATAGDWFVTTGGTGAQTGANWDNALPTVTAGLQKAQAGDKVWVWAGVYHERITLKPGVTLSGGHFFADVWLPFWSFLDGDNGGSVVTVPPGTGADTILEGFTLQNGSGTSVGGITLGGGLYCVGASPTIRANHFTACRATNGGGAYLGNSSANLSGCHFTGNLADGAGGGINTSGGAPVVAVCTFRGNSAGVAGGAAMVAGAPNALVGCSVFEANQAPAAGSAVQIDGGWFLNNTLWRNLGTATGVLTVRPGAPVAVVNTIISGNSSGLSVVSGAAPAIYNNDVFANGAANYSGVADPSGTNGNISLDPALDDPASGDFTPCLGSPCIDRGTDAVVPVGAIDYYLKPRIAGAGVDIGAAEAVIPAPLPAIRVKQDTGSDANDGLTWATAKKSVYAGVTAAIAAGREVWVAAAYYPEWFVVTNDNVMLFGGFAGTETKRNERDPAKNETTIGAWGTDRPVLRFINVAPAAGKQTVVDGFTIKDGLHSGNGGLFDGAGIVCLDSSVVITGNRIAHNKGTGVYCSGSAIAPYIACNVFDQNQSGEDGVGGLIVTAPSGYVLHNTFLHNGTVGSTHGAGAITYHATGPPAADAEFEIRDNLIDGNWGKYSGGIHVGNGTASMRTVIRNNVIRNNDAYDPERSAGIYAEDYVEICNNVLANNGGLGGAILYGGHTNTDTKDSIIANNTLVDGGVTMFDGRLVIDNNTIVRHGSGKGVSLVKPGPYFGNYTGTVTVRNNIFTGCETAVYRNTQTVLSVSTVLSNNAFYGNASNYDGLAAGTGDLFLDPRLASPSTGDYHLLPDSPCIDAGLDAAVLEGWTDCDGEARILGAHVDIGSDEYSAATALKPVDIGLALRITGGLAAATSASMAALDVVNTGASQARIDMQDVVSLMRKAAGLG